MSKGLAGAVVADTKLSLVDGENGVLIYRGYDMMDLGPNSTFEEVVYLLWNGRLPNADELHEVKAALAAQRSVPEFVVDMLRRTPTTAHPMAVLRTAVSALGLIDLDADNISQEELRKKAGRLTASMPTIVAAWERIRNGQEPIAPRADLGHAANFLYMLSGNEPDAAAVRAFDAYLVLLTDHGFNASTFAARVTFATISDMYSAITSAVGTLKGDAHGRANQKAMEQFVAAAERGVDEWYADTRASGQRIMGVGHRVYKVLDPRATILKPMAEEMARSSGAGEWFGVASHIETLTREDAYFVERNLYANVDYYSAIVLYMVGLPMDQFTCAFAISRVAGWTAHVMEQALDNRLIRPKANYIGDLDLEYVPLEAR